MSAILAGRVMSRVQLDKKTGCWLCSYVKERGYPVIHAEKRSGKMLRCSNVLYEFNGHVIPKGQVLQPTCGRTHCVNPDHMRLGWRTAPNFGPIYTEKDVRSTMAKLNAEYAAAQRLA